MRLVDFLLCDDIRFEQHNKVSLMGIYNEALNVEAEDPSKIVWPIGLKFGIYVRLLKESSDNLKNGVKLPFALVVRKEGKDGEELAKIEGEFSHTDEASPYISFPLVLPPIAIPGPCKLKFDFKIGNAMVDTPLFEIRQRNKPAIN